MLLYVKEIRHDGLVLGEPGADVGEYWLPASDWEGRAASWKEFRHASEPGLPVNVRQVDGKRGPESEGLQVVSMRNVGRADIDNAWKGEVHGMRIDRLSRTLIFGTIGSIEAVMDRKEYTDRISQLPQSDHIQDHAALAVGDFICGTFRAEEGPMGRVLVSFEDALTSLKHETEERVAAQSRRSATLNTEDDAGPELPPAAELHAPPEAVSPLLFVENDELCREMWQGFLEKAGIEVHGCATLEEAEAAITKPDADYKMAIVDVHLTPGANDYLGLEFTESLVAAMPGCRTVLTSAEDNTGQDKNGHGDTRVYGYIEKPALLEEWAAAIDAAVAAEGPTALREFVRDSRLEEDSSPDVDTDEEDTEALSLAGALSAFQKEAPGVIAHVFRVHPRSWRGRSLAGAGNLKWEPYRGKLGRSVIKDAAETKEAIVDNDASDDWRHKWTKQMASYRSCWAKRLPVGGIYRHVLMALHADPEFFTTEMQLRARCCAETVTRVLTSELLERRGTHDSEQSSAGLGFACLAHEIYSTLNGVEVAVRGMSNALPDPGKPLAVEGTQQLRRTVELLGAHVPDLVINARILRGRAGGSKPVSVAFCLEKAVTGIREARWELLERPQNINVEFQSPDDGKEWMVRANASALVTVFFNVLLNAVQQIEQHASVRPKGTVDVCLRHYLDDDGLPWALVFVRDSGLGIHPDDWERIFDAGHTTKDDGTGLGLHICRQLLGRIQNGPQKASIRIVRSALWAGTTVGIRLPLTALTDDGE